MGGFRIYWHQKPPTLRAGAARTQKTKNKELTKEQKLHNQHVSKVRVVVEHAIGGMKRYF
jgi:hypothetical protein